VRLVEKTPAVGDKQIKTAVIVVVEKRGPPRPPGIADAAEVCLIGEGAVAGDKFVVKRGEEVIAAGTSKLDPSKKPKTTVITYTEGRDKGKTFKGIYQLDGDKVKFCRPGSPDDDFPTEFKTTPGSGAFISIYTRAKR